MRKITTLKMFEPFTDDEIAVLTKAINTFSDGGHPMPDKTTLGGFSKTWVTGLLRKSEKFLSKKPEHERDLITVRKLMERFAAEVAHHAAKN